MKLYDLLKKHSIENADRIKAAENEIDSLVCETQKDLDLDKKRDIDARIAILSDEIKTRRVMAQIVHDNLRRAYVNSVLPIVQEEFSKYDGKAYGEKTKEKIRSAIAERTNCSVYVSFKSYNAAILSLVPLNESGYKDNAFRYNELDLVPLYDKETRTYDSVLTSENKINSAALDWYYLRDCMPLCNNPKEHAEKIIELSEKRKEVLKELKTLESEYNSLLPSGIERATHTAQGYRL